VPTRADLERFIAETERDIAALTKQLGRQRRWLATLRETLRDWTDDSDLSTKQSRSIIRSDMHLENTPTTKSMRIASRRTKRRHVAKRAWLEAGKTDEAIAEEAAKLVKRKVSRATVNAWCAKGDNARPVPRVVVEHFEKPPYSIPRSAWAKLGE
jgi:hypothetical protein